MAVSFTMCFVIVIEKKTQAIINEFGSMNEQSLPAALPLFLHLNKLQLNCEINHPEVLGSDKDPATQFYFF